MSYFIKSFFALQKSSIVLTLKGSIDITYSIFHQNMSIYSAKEHYMYSSCNPEWV